VREVILASAGELGVGELLEQDVGLAVEDAVALPSRPSARTCCRLSSLKMLVMLARGTTVPLAASTS